MAPGVQAAPGRERRPGAATAGPDRRCLSAGRRNSVWTLIDSWRGLASNSYAMTIGKRRTDVLQGTLDLMVPKTLAVMGPQHGYGIARRIEQISDDVLQLNEGTVYASLLRLRQRRLISASWGRSENNRRARFYTITGAGRRQLSARMEDCERIAAVMARVLRLSADT